MIIFIPPPEGGVDMDPAELTRPLDLRDWKVWLFMFFVTATLAPIWYIIATVALFW